LQIDPSSHFGHSHSGQTFGVACRCSRADPAKLSRPISSFDETIVLSHITVDSDGGIFWGAFSAQGGAQTPQGSRSGAVEVRSEFRQTSIPVLRPGRIYLSSSEHILTVGSSDRVFQLVAVTVFLRNRSFLPIYPCMHQICYLRMITGNFLLFYCIPVQIQEILLTSRFYISSRLLYFHA
jgi:hypothetical protein